MISEQLLRDLRCPADRSRLKLADEELIARLNQAIREGRLRNVGGQSVQAPLDGGLVREDGTVLYAIREGLPIMLVDEGIPLSQSGI